MLVDSTTLKSAKTSSSTYLVNKSSCACRIDRLLHQQQHYIFITSAQPTHLPRQTFIVYHIRLNDIETKRRYSDFESLRKLLVQLYPVCLLPPIPGKHSILDYAAGTKKNDQPTIERRKRMLQTFLNQLTRHPQLGRDHFFHQFLTSNVDWAQIIHSSSVSFLSKQHPLHMMTSPTSSSNAWVHQPLLSHRIVPTPTSSAFKQKPDPFLFSEEKYTRMANFMHQHIEKNQRKVIRRLDELANDYAELAALYNGFSLNEMNTIAIAIEKMGQTVDDAYTKTGDMVLKLEGEFIEPTQSQIQMARVVKQVIQFRYLKQVQLEMVQQAYDDKRYELDRLLRMDHQFSLEQSRHDQQQIIPSTSYVGRMFSSVGYSLQHLIDADPSSTRRNQIGKYKEAIQMLEEALSICRNDTRLATEQLEKEIARFEDDNILTLRETLMAFADVHLQYCQKNLQAWQDTKHKVNQISR
ncbi:uncharacterized protein BX664DRAFT_323974 [Halteromyces radiatus]|uniref:uncharacterized protein n=1 Tax=Halteromyces radiatus TaxID=101107 RepID=UPI0022206A0A|nr:uncharacterized protein BX664DRAFT_323974 [Halteromyces radiatus]KAI8096428.1 hypothetical protein BX664DRAFT_323974 [Halteromyces radiatus]